MVVRSEESENGIQVFDSNGNAVGVSKEAGSKVRLNLIPPKLLIIKLLKYILMSQNMTSHR